MGTDSQDIGATFCGDNRLRIVLDRYYRVNGRTFFEIHRIEACKHQVLHLAKLIKKLTLYVFGRASTDEQIVIQEVAPDLLIYAQELIWKFNLVSVPEMEFINSELTPMRRALADTAGYADITEVLIAICLATAAISDMCDKSDHYQNSSFDAYRDAVTPFLRGAATLEALFACDIDTLYTKRLDYMREKYERWA